MFFSTFAQAGLDLQQLVDDAFDEIMIDNQPSAIRKAEAGRMGFVGGGSLRIRTPTFTPDLISIKAPRISAPNCNSVDMNFGAFSFISLDDIKQLLRSVVSQASTYAFSLAMNAICGDCMAVMQKLADKANEFAAKAKDSCFWAKELVHASVEKTATAVSENDQEANELIGSMGLGVVTGGARTRGIDAEGADWSGWSEGAINWAKDATNFDVWDTDPPEAADPGDAILSSGDEPPPIGNILRNNPNSSPRVIWNVTWDVLSLSNMDAWSSSTSTNVDVAKRMFMTAMGTHLRVPANTVDNGYISGVDNDPIAHTLEFATLLNPDIETIDIWVCQPLTNRSGDGSAMHARVLEIHQNTCIGHRPDTDDGAFFAKQTIPNPIYAASNRISELYREYLWNQTGLDTSIEMTPQHYQVGNMDPFGIVGLAHDAPAQFIDVFVNLHYDKVRKAIPRLVTARLLRNTWDMITVSRTGFFSSNEQIPYFNKIFENARDRLERAYSAVILENRDLLQEYTNHERIYNDFKKYREKQGMM